MDPNSGKKDMFNKSSREEGLKALALEAFKRKTISFYKYIFIKSPYDLRDKLYSEWNGLGVLGRICSLIGERGANITNIDFVNRKPDFYSIIIEMQVKDLKHLSDIMTSIEADTDIAVVVRTREVLETPSNQNTKILSKY